MNDELFKFIVARIVENISKQENENSLFEQGKKLAYYETLDIIKSELSIHNLSLEDYGLDIELETLL